MAITRKAFDEIAGDGKIASADFIMEAGVVSSFPLPKNPPIKPGFKFEDKGHANEQITWLVLGKMDFYANGKNKTLTSDIGVDIGPNHIHGGVSGGALGYDAFYPKREEIKYKKEEI